LLLALDLKNFSGQSGGIIGMYAPLIAEIAENENFQVVGLVPKSFSGNNYSFPVVKIGSSNKIPLPKIFESLFYNHWYFPKALKSTNADIFLSPYFDVSFNKSIASVITIHDMCFFEVPKEYRFLRRKYFQYRTRKSAQNATVILTDSQTSKKYIRDFLNVSESKIFIVQNQLNTYFQDFAPKLDAIKEFKNRFCIAENAKILLYSSGFENRKNIENFLKSAEEVLNKGYFDKVLITGGGLNRWVSTIRDLDLSESNFVFTGILDPRELKTAYLVSSAMIFPSLSEGFGRPNMEAMFLGIPIACSDIPVFREFCQDYPVYFDPYSRASIVSALTKVSFQLKRSPQHVNQYGMTPDDLVRLLIEVGNDHAG
jgi:glycosyltransferase involved in cell wall biosynthesis